MKVICGLGNPGQKYAETRHNIGFQVLDALSKKHGISLSKKKFKSLYTEENIHNKKVLFIKPQTFMNNSGEALKACIHFFNLQPKNVLVIHDEIDFPFGKIKTKFAGGHAGHNGLRSIFEHIGTDEFYRLRIGIGRPFTKEDVSNYVLGPFSKEQKQELEDILNRAIGDIEKFIEE